ncbi:MAG: hypothetical protein K6G88_13460 [Lachnospiraceae bacterium]|nr:hypothetical protein [Lachnospiraceae bacterium]
MSVDSVFEGFKELFRYRHDKNQFEIVFNSLRQTLESFDEGQLDRLSLDGKAGIVSYIKDNKCNQLFDIVNKKMIVSFTSYPERIEYAALVAENMVNQTFPADEIVLWLAEEQFEDKEALPKLIKELVAQEKLTIKWCYDLKSHKKYFYAMQEYVDAIIITIDDDINYSSRTLEHLFCGYISYPKSISSLRTHLIVTDDKEVRPYSYWIKECDGYIQTPSMRLLATGCAGILYPPAIFETEFFDESVIEEMCLNADDLWLKALEIYYDIPTVLVRAHDGISVREGSQETSLWNSNITENDVQWNKICQWFKEKTGKDILNDVLAKHPKDGKAMNEILVESYMNEKMITKKKRNESNTRFFEINEKLKIAYEEKSEINAKLQKTYEEKSEINAKLQKTYEEKSEINAKLQKTYEEKSEINAKLQKAYESKDEAKAKLSEIREKYKQDKQTYKEEKKRLKEKIQKLQDKITNMNERLTKAESFFPYRVYRFILRKILRKQ